MGHVFMLPRGSTPDVHVLRYVPEVACAVFSHVWYNLGQHVVKKWGLSGSRHQEFQPSEPSRTGRNEALPRFLAPLHRELFFVAFSVFLYRCIGSLLLHGLFLVAASRSYSLVMMSRLLIAVAYLLWSTVSRPCGLNSCGTKPSGMWDLPRSGIKPVSPALAGGFVITEPPGKPQ